MSLLPAARGLAVVLVLVGTAQAAIAQANALPSRTAVPPADVYLEVVEAARQLARTIIAEDNLPGFSIAVGLGDEIIWAEGIGWADITDSIPITPRTRFPTGSAFKTVTATAIALLVERGMIDLDAPVQRYVPDFPEKRWPVTTRHLLGHVAGIRHYRDQDEVFDQRHCEAVAEGLGVFAEDRLLFEPGTDYQYSTFGFVLLGAIVASAAGEPYLDFVAREIFTPSGMVDTSPDRVDRAIPNLASYYFPSADRRTQDGIEPAPVRDQSCILPGGGFVSTPSDLVRFGMAFMAGELLAPETLELMWTEGHLSSGDGTGYGMGWFVRRVPLVSGSEPTLVLGHGGSSVGGSTSFVTLPEYGLAVSVTSNVSYAQRTSRLGLTVARRFASLIVERQR